MFQAQLCYRMNLDCVSELSRFRLQVRMHLALKGHWRWHLIGLICSTLHSRLVKSLNTTPLHKDSPFNQQKGVEHLNTTMCHRSFNSAAYLLSISKYIYSSVLLWNLDPFVWNLKLKFGLVSMVLSRELMWFAVCVLGNGVKASSVS